MKNILFFMLLLALLFGSCSRAGVRKDIPLGQKQDSLAYNCGVFRSNLDHARKYPYTVSNTVLLTALSNEFVVDLSMERKLSNAIEGYQGLTNVFAGERGYLYQRMGVCYFKLNDMAKANKYIHLAILENADDPELYFYLSMLLNYHKKEPSRALAALKYVDLSRIDIHKQDYLAYQASIYTSLKHYQKAFELYRAAILVDPRRFYMNYDLTYFLSSSPGLEKELSIYIRKSFSQLSDMKEKPFRVKGYRQMVLLNRLERKDTLEYRYHFSDGYEYFPVPLYYYNDPRPVERVKSYHLQIPLKDKRNYSSEKIYYTVFEDYIDRNGRSGIFLTESMLDITSMTHPFLSAATRVPKIVGTNTAVLILSPTNIYILSTNQYAQTNSKNYIITNQSNAVYLKDLNFTYYADTGYFDMDRNGGWDYVFFGFNRNREAVVSFFYPDTAEWSTVRFPVKKPDAEFVLQDFNGDGRTELVLLDDDVYFLTNVKMQ